MAFALRNLDTGLFYDKAGWTHTPTFAKHFQDREAVEKIADEQNVKNAELAFVSPKGEYFGGIPIRISS